MKILIVEDNLNHLTYLENLLNDRYELIDPSDMFNINDVINTININRPNLVLLDIELWGVLTGGLEIAQYISKNHPKISFFFITIINDEVRREFAFSVGPKSFLNKFSIDSKAMLDDTNLINQIELEKAKLHSSPDYIKLNDRKFSKKSKQFSTYDIDYFEKREKGKINAFQKNNNVGFITESFSSLKDKLPPTFIRITNNLIINILSENISIDTRKYIIKFNYKDEDVMVSRRYKEELKSKMNI